MFELNVPWDEGCYIPNETRGLSTQTFEILFELAAVDFTTNLCKECSTPWELLERRENH